MTMVWLDHVNIRTTQLDEMVEFYENALGLKRGKRPLFEFGGAWIYCGKQAIVHLVESEDDVKPGEAQVEHFALRASGSMKAFQQRLRKNDAPYNVISIEELNMRQVNVFDPDGNKIEVQFAATDNDDLEPFHGSKQAYKRFKKGMKLNKTRALRVSKSKSKVAKTNKNLGVPAPIKDPRATTARRRKPATPTAAPARAAASSPPRAAAPKSKAKAAARPTAAKSKAGTAAPKSKAKAPARAAAKSKAKAAAPKSKAKAAARPAAAKSKAKAAAPKSRAKAPAKAAAAKSKAKAAAPKSKAKAAAKPATKKPAAKKPAAGKPAAKKPAARKPAAARSRARAS